ncbi:MAG TPA: hypothetical protein VGL56_09790 [Fimbriimonadaceae bacterium]|jgi:hypothetical protein
MTFRIKLAAAAICLATATALLPGCSSSSSSSGTPVTTTNPLGDATIVTDDPTTILPWAQIVGQTNVKAFIRESESAYAIYQRPITIASAYVVAGEDVLACTCPSTDSYGAGDSGSPVLVNGKIVGALFAGDDPQHFYVISISQEETTGATTTTTKAKPAALKSGPTPYPNAWNFSGPASMMPLVTKNKNFTQTQHVQPALRPQQATSGAIKILPGLRFAACILNGPQAQLYDQATLTYQLPSGQWVGTGHMLGSGGTAQWPVFPAYTDFIENNGTVETHLAAAANGTLLFDGMYGSLLDLTKTPSLMPINVAASLNGTNLASITHFGILDRGSANEEEAVDIGGATPIDTDIYALPDVISGTGTVTTVQGGVPTVTQMSFSAPSESPAAFVNDVETNVDEAWFEAYGNTPNEQVTSVSVSVQMITAPVTN